MIPGTLRRTRDKGRDRPGGACSPWGAFMDEAVTARVLLVESQPLVREYASVVLREDGGFAVVEAASLDQARRLLDTQPAAHAVVLDLTGPDYFSGMAFARLVAAHWPQARLVITTGTAWPAGEPLPPGTVVLAKPYAPRDLVHRVRQSLAASGARLLPAVNECS